MVTWYFFFSPPLFFLLFAVTPQESEVFTSLSAARSLLEQEGQRPLLLVEESALEDFTGGFRLLQLLAGLADPHPAVFWV